MGFRRHTQSVSRSYITPRKHYSFPSQSRSTTTPIHPQHSQQPHVSSIITHRRFPPTLTHRMAPTSGSDHLLHSSHAPESTQSSICLKPLSRRSSTRQLSQFLGDITRNPRQRRAPGDEPNDNKLCQLPAHRRRRRGGVCGESARILIDVTPGSVHGDCGRRGCAAVTRLRVPRP